MKILISGAGGLVGSALTSRLQQAGHAVVPLTRSGPAQGGRVLWDPSAGRLDPSDLIGLDAVVHLAGESIAEGRWNADKKARIRDSRVKGTNLLASALAGLDQKPRVLVCASAIGYYGDRGDEALTEQSPPGSGFLPEVCVEWENACAPATEAGIRTVHVRIGIVLSPDGGALAKMLFPFKMGVGGKLGSGDQYMSWVSLPDLVAILDHAVTDDTLRGPVNGTAPNPVTNTVYTKTLGRVLSRPTLFPMPAFAARLAFGEMADALLLASTRVVPERLTASGFAFQHPDLETALRAVLGR